VTLPRLCITCQARPIAYTGRKHCYDCVPRARKSILACKLCGSTSDYWSGGRCRHCHRSAPMVDSCQDCLGWGVTRRGGWTCEACRGWRRRFPTPATCLSCQRLVTVTAAGYCRLCSRQATLARSAHLSRDMVEGNRHGQQLFLVNLFRNRLTPLPAPLPVRPRWPLGYPVEHEQLLLIDQPRDLNRGRRHRFPEPPLPELTAALEQTVREYASQHGWKPTSRGAALYGIRILLSIQDTPGARIRYSEATQLQQLPSMSVQVVIDVLASVGMVTDDREAPLTTWFARLTEDLSEPMRTELQTWFLAMRDGSTTRPRRRPLKVRSVRVSITHLVPALQTWNDAGHTSLREITPDDVRNVLPSDAVRRQATLSSVRRMFRHLKSCGLVFTNPAARVPAIPVRANIPLPMEVTSLREALNSSNPAAAAVVALLAFHGPRLQHLRYLQLTDVRDGRLYVDGRTIVLAGPVRDRLRTWLDERARRWPHTLNPHLFINKHTALRTTPVSNVWIGDILNLPASDIRDDRILDEAIATNGDVRRLEDLFGISTMTALRYTHSSEQPLNPETPTGSRT
jgi:hypothetical protein